MPAATILCSASIRLSVAMAAARKELGCREIETACCDRSTPLENLVFMQQFNSAHNLGIGRGPSS